MPIFWEIANRQDMTLVESKCFECGIVVLKYAKATKQPVAADGPLGGPLLNGNVN